MKVAHLGWKIENLQQNQPPYLELQGYRSISVTNSPLLFLPTLKILSRLHEVPVGRYQWILGIDVGGGSPLSLFFTCRRISPVEASNAMLISLPAMPTWFNTCLTTVEEKKPEKTLGFLW